MVKNFCVARTQSFFTVKEDIHMGIIHRLLVFLLNLQACCTQMGRDWMVCQSYTVGINFLILPVMLNATYSPIGVPFCIFKVSI